MESWAWAVFVIATGSAVGISWWKRRARRVYAIDHVSVELHPPCVIEDRVVEVVWRAAISMTNTSRKPRPVPVLAEGATARAGRYVYLADVYLDADVRDLNPRDVALAWVEFVLPSDWQVDRIDAGILTCARPRLLRWVTRAEVGVRSGRRKARGSCPSPRLP